VRWQPFVGSIERFVLAILAGYREIVSVNYVKLEYWDRFFWSGNWEDFAVDRLLKKGDYVAARVYGTRREWHSHVGWFEPIGALRRLTNVNIDVGKLSQACRTQISRWPTGRQASSLILKHYI
jgi:hypothetical protein